MAISCLVSDVCPSNCCSIGSNFRFVIIWEVTHAAVKQKFKLILQRVTIFQVKFDLLIRDLKEILHR